LRNGACFGGTESGSGYFILVGILLRLRLLKLKAVVLLGEVCPHHFPEVLTMISEKFVTYSMRCMSIGIAVAIFLLSAQSKLPIPPSISFPGLDKLLHACAFGGLAFALSFWFSADAWSAKPLKYAMFVCCIAACYGVSDEIHQIFVPGRDASIYDWFADCTGAVLAVTFRVGLMKFRSR
jgi:hypothetical protein